KSRPRFAPRSRRSRRVACSRIRRKRCTALAAASIATRSTHSCDSRIARPEMVDRLALRLPSYATNLVARHWPGPLTLVLPGGENRVPDRLRGPEGGIAVGWTSHPAVARLIRAHGDAITSTSANRPGVPPANSAREILEQWSDAVARGQLRVLDGGSLNHSKPSTVLDCTGRLPRVIRPGEIPAKVLRESVPNLIGDA